MIKYVDWCGFKVFPCNVPLARPGLYVFINLVNRKPYYGMTAVPSGIAGRCAGHGKNSPSKLRNAIKKYGKESFLLIPLYYVVGEVDKEFLLKNEAILISENNTIKNGYNVIEAGGGTGIYGPEHSQLVRDGTLLAMSRPDVKANHRKAMDDPDVQARRLTAINDAWLRPERRKNHSEGCLKGWANPEIKASRVEAIKHSHSTPEFRQNMRAARLLATPEQEERRITALRLALAKPDVQERRAASYSEGCKKEPLKWITNGIDSKTIKISKPIPDGWYPGRIRDW